MSTIYSWLSNATFVALFGDSYPNDHIEQALRDRLPGRFLGQGEIGERYGDGVVSHHVPARIALLHKTLSAQPAGDIILVGRSSGGRVATRLAADQPGLPGVRAIACLGYPFQRPQKDPEPDRYSHLTRLTVPSLILQGDRDEYGDVTRARDYALSDAVRLEFISSNHNMNLTPKAWDYVAGRICDFAARQLPPAQTYHLAA